MKLRDLMENQLSIQRHFITGREFVIADRDVLILGIVSFPGDSVYYDCDDTDEENKDEQGEIINRMYLLYEDPYRDYDEEEYEEMTNREQLIRYMELEAERKPGVPDIEAFIISGKRFPSLGMSNSPLDESGLTSFIMLHQAMLAGEIADKWMDIDTGNLWIAAYDVKGAIDEIDRQQEAPDFSVELEQPAITNYVGKRFTCACKVNEEPYTITIAGMDGEALQVSIYGLFVMDFDDESFLILEYETAADLQMNFYRADYLDDFSDNQSTPAFFFGSDDDKPNRRYAFIDRVDADFNESVELELLSYTAVQTV